MESLPLVSRLELLANQVFIHMKLTVRNTTNVIMVINSKTKAVQKVFYSILSFLSAIGPRTLNVVPLIMVSLLTVYNNISRVVRLFQMRLGL